MDSKLCWGVWPTHQQFETLVWKCYKLSPVSWVNVYYRILCEYVVYNLFVSTSIKHPVRGRKPSARARGMTNFGFVLFSVIDQSCFSVFFLFYAFDVLFLLLLDTQSYKF